MLLSHQNRFVFLHIPKCAGTSAGESLRAIGDWPVRLLGYSPLFERYQARFRRLHKHMMAHRVKEIVGDETWRSYYKFTFVRNPLTRAVSYYTWVGKMVREAQAARWLPDSMGAKRELLNFPVTEAFLNTKNFSEFIRHPSFLNDHGCRPQLDFITDPETDEIVVDFIGKVETFEDDMRTLGLRLAGRPLATRMANVSLKRGSNAASMVNEDDNRYLHNLYASDFERLGYSTPLD